MKQISKERLEQIAQRAIDWISFGTDAIDAYADLTSGLGLSEDELRTLGYSYIVDEYYKAEKED